jgi:hypothetical protein
MITLPPLSDLHAWQREADRIERDDRKRVDSQSPASSAGLANDGDGYDGLAGRDDGWLGAGGGLEGGASEADLTSPQQESLDRVLAELRKYPDHPVIGGLLGRAEGAVAKAEGSLDRVEKGLMDLLDAGTRIAKAETTAAREVLRKAERDLGTEWAYQVGGGARMAVERREQCLKAGIPLG